MFDEKINCSRAKVGRTVFAMQHKLEGILMLLAIGLAFKEHMLSPTLGIAVACFLVQFLYLSPILFQRAADAIAKKPANKETEHVHHIFVALEVIKILSLLCV